MIVAVTPVHRIPAMLSFFVTGIRSWEFRSQIGGQLDRIELNELVSRDQIEIRALNGLG